MLSASIRVRDEMFHADAVIPGTMQLFPQELWNVSLGTSYRHLFDNGWTAGGGVSVGSASDRPFDAIRDMTVGVNGFLARRRGTTTPGCSR